MQTNGSLQNLLAHNGRNTVKPAVGMGVTEIHWTDRRPFTIVEVVSDREIRVQRDDAKRIDACGESDCQSYEYSQNTGAPIHALVLKRTKKHPDGRGRRDRLEPLHHWIARDVPRLQLLGSIPPHLRS